MRPTYLKHDNGLSMSLLQCKRPSFAQPASALMLAACEVFVKDSAKNSRLNAQTSETLAWTWKPKKKTFMLQKFFRACRQSCNAWGKRHPTRKHAAVMELLKILLQPFGKCLLASQLYQDVPEGSCSAAAIVLALPMPAHFQRRL